MKTKIKTLLLIACCIFFMNCNEKENDLNPNLNVVNQSKFGFVMDGKPSNTVSYREIVSMLHQYDKTRSEALNKALGKEDSRHVFFSEKDLKDFISEVETLSKEKNIEFSGVSFLSSAYPQDYYDFTKRGMRTLILMPNTIIGTDDAVVFDPSQSFLNRPTTLNQIIKRYGFNESKKIFNQDLNTMNKSQDIPSIGMADKKLSYKEIISMLAEYNSNKADLLEKVLGKEDVRKSFLDLATLKSYLAYVEELSIEKNIELTGINIMFGAYPNNYTLKPIKSNYQSIIFMPTTNVDGKNEMFDPLNSEFNQPKLTKEILADFGYNFDDNLSKRKSFVFQKNSGNLESSGANRLGTRPPLPCDQKYDCNSL